MAIVQRKIKVQSGGSSMQVDNVLMITMTAGAEKQHQHQQSPLFSKRKEGAALAPLLMWSLSDWFQKKCSRIPNCILSVLLLFLLFAVSILVSRIVMITFASSYHENILSSVDWSGFGVTKLCVLNHRPRLFYMNARINSNSNNNKWRMNDTFAVDPILHVLKGEESVQQSDEGEVDQSNCIPMSSWQTMMHPTCNKIHEIGMTDVTAAAGRNEPGLSMRNNISWASIVTSIESLSYTNDEIRYLGQGWYRQTWKVDSTYDIFVLKTLRIDRDFLREYYESHRKDAVASERLSSSPYVIDIYSFCAQSVVNEYAAFKDGISKLKDFILYTKKMKGKNMLKLKLMIAHMVAQGVQHIHEIDGPKNLTTLVHYDINPSNVLITAKGIPKINDFNVAHFFYWDDIKQERCPFVGYLTSQPWWRAPEEMNERPVIDEKVDIYSLGNILFNIMVGHSPRRPSRNETGWLEKVHSDVKAGIPPSISEEYTLSKEPEIGAFVKAIHCCYQENPNARSRARDIVSILEEGLSHS